MRKTTILLLAAIGLAIVAYVLVPNLAASSHQESSFGRKNSVSQALITETFGKPEFYSAALPSTSLRNLADRLAIEYGIGIQELIVDKAAVGRAPAKLLPEAVVFRITFEDGDRWNISADCDVKRPK